MTTSVATAAGLFQPGSPVPADVIDLGIGNPDTETLPAHALDIGLLSPAQRHAALAYGPPGGNTAVIEALRGTVVRDIDNPEAVLITNGALDAVILALRTLCAPEAVLLAEESTFPGLISAARDLAIDIMAVKTGPHGIDPEDLQSKIDRLRWAERQVAALYLMPTAANPTGSCISSAERQTVAAIAREHSLTIIEDDAYRDIFFEPVAPAPLVNLAPEHVIHIRSLSKVVCPGIRLAVTTGPKRIIERMRALQPVGGTSPLASELLAGFLGRIDYPVYIESVRETYRTRRDLAVSRLSSQLSRPIPAPKGGFFLWVDLPDGTTGSNVYAAAINRGVRILPGAAFSVSRVSDQFIRVSYSCASATQLTTGIDVLVGVLNGTGK